MRHWIAPPVLAMLAGLAAAGCASGPGGGHKDLPTQYPAVVEDWSGSTIDRVEFIKPFTLGQYQRVAVQHFDTSKVALPDADDNTRKPVERAIVDFDQTLAKGVRESLEKVIPVEIQAAPGGGGGGGGTLVVRGTVKEINPGSRAARAFASFGAGRSKTEVDGEIVDGATGQVLIKFNHAKASGIGLFGGDYDDFIHDDIMDVGKDIGLLIGAHIEPGTKK